MLKTMISAVAIVLPLGAAVGQSTNPVSSDVDTHAPSRIGGAPGTVGAMDAVARGVAVSADDVVAQQQGLSTAAAGNQPIAHGSGIVSAGYASGTIGATPGRSPMVGAR